VDRINQSVREGLISELKALDLSSIAAKTYLALLYRPSASAGFLCNETGVPDSKIYYALNELSKKGMIVVQEGTPNTYRALHPKEALGNLKQQLVEGFNKQISQADRLVDSLSPIFESVEGKDEMELAYVIRGRRNIARKMNDLITSSKKEVLAMIYEDDLWNELSSSMAKVSDNVEAKVAVPRKLLKSPLLKGRAESRILKCNINMVISDMRMLITVSSWENEVAIMTNDKALMTISQEYYENPKCCII